VAGHEVCAASALSVVAAVLLTRSLLAGRRGRPRTAGVSRRAARRTALRDGRRTGCGVPTGQGLPTDVAGAQRAVRDAEGLVHGYWRQLSPLYLSQRDPRQH
jgi:hypothetical protein